MFARDISSGEVLHTISPLQQSQHEKKNDIPQSLSSFSSDSKRKRVPLIVRVEKKARKGRGVALTVPQAAKPCHEGTEWYEMTPRS